MNARLVVALVFAALVVACGSSGGSSSSSGSAGSGSTSGSTTGSGSTSGTSGSVLSGALAFPVGALLLFTHHDANGNPTASKLTAKLFGPAFSCTDATGTYPVTDFQDVEVELESGDGSDVQPGSYDLASLPANLSVTVSILTHSATGESGVNANTGTVNVTAASTTEMSGTFSVTFSGGSLEGSFNAPYCH